MRPLRASLPLLLLAALARAGTVVDVGSVDIHPVTGTKVELSPLEISPKALVPQPSAPTISASIAGPLIPTLVVPSKVDVVAGKGGALSAAPVARLTTTVGKLSPKDEKKASDETKAGALNALYGEGGAASVADPSSGGESVHASGLKPYAAGEYSAPVAKVPVPEAKRPKVPWLSRFPVFRGEITWKQTWSYLNPGSADNTIKYNWGKSDRMLDEESERWSHNAGYALGFRDKPWSKMDAERRAEKRRLELAETGAKVRAFYGLPAFTTLSPPLVELGPRLGEGGQATAYEVKGKPHRAVKVFRHTGGRQLQEMAAILNAVADQGYPAERVTLVRLPNGDYGLEMRRFDRSEGWSDLAMYTRLHRGEPTAREAERKAEELLHAIGRETKKALGFDAADWKAGFTGEISDDHLENFFYHRETQEVAGFDPLVRW